MKVFAFFIEFINCLNAFINKNIFVDFHIMNLQSERNSNNLILISEFIIFNDDEKVVNFTKKASIFTFFVRRRIKIRKMIKGNADLIKYS